MFYVFLVFDETMTMTKNTSIILIAVVAAVMVAGMLAVTVTVSNAYAGFHQFPGNRVNGGNTGGSATGEDQGLRGIWHNEVHQ
jgi:hypothetical protein